MSPDALVPVATKFTKTPDAPAGTVGRGDPEGHVGHADDSVAAIGAARLRTAPPTVR